MLYDVIFLMTAIGKISIQFVYYECTIFPFPNDRYGINRNNKGNFYKLPRRGKLSISPH